MSYDLIVIGAGPAGMSAAVTATELGLSVVVLDEQPEAGGQIWRAVDQQKSRPVAVHLGPEYTKGATTTAAFRASAATVHQGVKVYQIEPGFRVVCDVAGKVTVLHGKAILLATGAQERPNPFPGWTLPGVMTVGAAQIVMKSAASIPDVPVWIAGNGPLPLLYAHQLLQAGGTVAGFLETTPPGALRRAATSLAGAVSSVDAVRKGLKWRAEVRRRAGVYVSGVTGLAAEGDGRIERLTYRTADGRERSVPCELLLAHEGVVPNIHAPLSMGCEMEWSDEQSSFRPRLDAWMESTVANVFVAGDAAGILGADAALLTGARAAWGVARRLGGAQAELANRFDADNGRQLDRHRRFRRFIDRWYRPRDEIFRPADPVMVCRCEELTAGDLRQAAEVGTPGPNQLKAFTRCGMGPCQGRQCGYTVNAILAEKFGQSPDEVGYFRIRPPLKQISLGELAAFEDAVDGD